VTNEELAGWEGLAVAEVGAAAVLTGLVFVAVSVNIDKVLSLRDLPGRAGETVILYLVVLVWWSLVLIPGQPLPVLGVEVLATALACWAALTAIARRGFRGPTRQPASWRATRIVGVQAVTLPAMVAGILLLADSASGLYWLVAGSLLSLLSSTGNAWVLLVEIVRDERYRPAEEVR
jgi:modulator of FtsH protease